MEYIEYPKALYRNGEFKVVPGVEEEEAARADGYSDWAQDQAKGEDDASEDDLKAERDALKTAAAALGIQFARNATNDKLRELIAAGKEG